MESHQQGHRAPDGVTWLVLMQRMLGIQVPNVPVSREGKVKGKRVGVNVWRSQCLPSLCCGRGRRGEPGCRWPKRRAGSALPAYVRLGNSFLCVLSHFLICEVCIIINTLQGSCEIKYDSCKKQIPKPACSNGSHSHCLLRLLTLILLLLITIVTTTCGNIST